MNRLTLAVVGSIAALGFVSTSYAADLIIETPVVPGVVDVSGNWDGPYIGVFGGWASGTADMTDPGAGPCSSGTLEGCDVDISGWLLGLKAGANFSVTSGLVAGVVADIAWSDVTGSDIFPGPVDESINTINWQGSVRGLLGFDGGAFLPYLTAGLAVANATHWSDYSNVNGIDEISNTHFGWTVGAGVAFAVTENVSLNLEYRYSDFGSAEYDHDTPVDPPEYSLTQHAVTAGINWSF
jgi:outer membrane immunogenic protein